MRKILSLACVVAVIGGYAPAAFCEDAHGAHRREGFWIGFGAGYGSASVSASCDGCSGDREGSFTGFLKLGGTLNPQVLLGVESNA